MSLRVRLAVVFALVAAVAAALMGSISYAVAAQRLERSADLALSEAAAPYVLALREEREVAATFGEEYARYRAATPACVPKFGGDHPAGVA